MPRRRLRSRQVLICGADLGFPLNRDRPFTDLGPNLVMAISPSLPLLLLVINGYAAQLRLKYRPLGSVLIHVSINTAPKAQSSCSWRVCRQRCGRCSVSQKHFISMVIKVPPALKKKAARARDPPRPRLQLPVCAAALLCLSLYMLDVQSGSLWRYNQPPAEPAFCPSPAAFCPLELPLQPPPLNRIYVYTTFTPIHLFIRSFFFFLSFMSPLLPQSPGRNICIAPSCCGNSCRGREREGTEWCK